MTKWGDEAVETVAATIYEKYKPRHHAAWDVFREIDGNREFMLKVARAAIIATLDCLATPSEEMAKAAVESVMRGDSIIYTVMLDAAKREIEGT